MITSAAKAPFQNTAIVAKFSTQRLLPNAAKESLLEVGKRTLNELKGKFPSIANRAAELKNTPLASKIINPAHFRVFSRLDIARMCVEVIEVVKEGDYKNNKLLVASEAVFRVAQVGLIFAFPLVGWAALGGLAAATALSLIWEFYVRDWLYNSPIELYIEKSLFYNNKGKVKLALNASSGGLVNALFGDEFAVYLPAQTLSNSVGEELEFKNANEVRAYLAKLYEKDPDLYNRAFKRELDELAVALRSYKVEIGNINPLSIYVERIDIKNVAHVYIYYKQQLCLNAPLFNDLKSLILVRDTRYSRCAKSETFDPIKAIMSDYKESWRTIPIVEIVEKGYVVGAFSKVALIAITNNGLALKYKLQFKIDKQKDGRATIIYDGLFGGSSVSYPIYDVSIDDCQSAVLTSDDLSHIEALEQKSKPNQTNEGAKQ